MKRTAVQEIRRHQGRPPRFYCLTKTIYTSRGQDFKPCKNVAYNQVQATNVASTVFKPVCVTRGLNLHLAEY